MPDGLPPYWWVSDNSSRDCFHMHLGLSPIEAIDGLGLKADREARPSPD